MTKPQIIKNTKLKWNNNFGIRGGRKNTNLMKSFDSCYILLFFSIFILNGCATKIPVVNDLKSYHESPYGGYIEVRVQGVQDILKFKGELISVDSKKIIVRTLQIPNDIRPFAVKDIISYKIYFASEKSGGMEGFFIFNSLATLTHGYFLLVTAPANLGIMSIIQSNKNKNLSFSSKEIPINQLYKFARFPNGLPPNITIHNLKNLIK